VANRRPSDRHRYAGRFPLPARRLRRRAHRVRRRLHPHAFSAGAELGIARGNLRNPVGLAHPGDPSGHPDDGSDRHRRHGAGLHLPAARDRSSLLVLGIVARNRHRVSPVDGDVRGVAGAACDQDFGADHTRRLAGAAFAETPPRPDENTPKTEAALTSNADRCGQRPDHLHHRRGVAGSVEIDINDPQNEQSNKCGGNGFHKRLTIGVRQVFRAAITCVVPPGP